MSSRSCTGSALCSDASSMLPATACTGARAARSSRAALTLTSPACRIRSTPSNTSATREGIPGAREGICVSERTPTRIGFLRSALQDERALRRRVPGLGLHGDGHALHVRKVGPDLHQCEPRLVGPECL